MGRLLTRLYSTCFPANVGKFLVLKSAWAGAESIYFEIWGGGGGGGGRGPPSPPGSSTYVNEFYLSKDCMLAVQC